MSVDGYDRLHGARAPFPRELLEQASPRAAPALLGSVLVRVEDDDRETVIRVVETEAYRHDDPASHSFRGRTARTEAMFGPPGTLYVYFTYGMHWCANVTTEPEGVGSAVLLRAGVVLEGEQRVRERRGARHAGRDLLRGPARLTQGLAIGEEQYGLDLLDPDSPVRLERDGWRPGGGDVVAGPRTGIREAPDVTWRFHVAGVPEVSRYVRHPRAPGPPG